VNEERVGLAVIYRWRVKPGLEEQCRKGWELVTQRYTAERGALGSRLHVAEDGTWVAYAQWPSRTVWQQAREMGPVEGSELMRDAKDPAAVDYPPIFLEPIVDHIKHVPIAPAGALPPSSAHSSAVMQARRGENMESDSERADLRLRWPVWIGVVCEDLEAQRRFYRDVLGLSELKAGQDWVWFDFDGRLLELLAKSPLPQYDRRRVSFAFDVDNIESARAELIQRGVEPVTGIEGGSKSLQYWTYFKDAEGNLFELVQRLP